MDHLFLERRMWLLHQAFASRGSVTAAQTDEIYKLITLVDFFRKSTDILENFIISRKSLVVTLVNFYNP